MRSSSRATSRRGLRPVTSKTWFAVALMTLARGSYDLYTRWPKPISRPSPFLTLSTKAGTLPVLPIFVSMRSTASLAPPWRGP